MRIVEFVPAGGIVLPLSSTDVGGALRELASKLGSLGGIDPERILKVLQEREALGSTAIGHEIAVPHGKIDVPRTIGAIGISPRGIDYGAPDAKPVRVVVALLSPLQGAGHLKALAAVAKELGDAAFRKRLVEACDVSEVYRLLSQYGS